LPTRPSNKPATPSPMRRAGKLAIFGVLALFAIEALKGAALF
jgi:hypothetical protein